MRTTTEHNEPTANRIRRATVRLALATAMSSTALVMAAEAAHARIVLNHNESAGIDRR
jgi:hypothetical protein